VAVTLLAGPAARAEASESHVFVVVMENKEYGEVMGDRDAPYLNRLADRYTSLSRFYAIRHPSLPNYLAMLGGSTFGVGSDCTGCDGIKAQSFVDELEEAGIGWRAYMEDMPGACYRGAAAGRYVKKHNPFAYFRDVYGDQSCKRVIPAKRLGDHLRGGQLADFNWITPNLCHDTHDCDVRAGDRYLSHLVPDLLERTGPHGFVVVTYDEGESGAGCCSGARGGRIPTVLAGPDVRRGADVAHPYSLYSLLSTFEDAYGVRRLSEAASAPPLAEAFEGGRLPRLGHAIDFPPPTPPPDDDGTPPSGGDEPPPTEPPPGDENGDPASPPPPPPAGPPPVRLRSALELTAPAMPLPYGAGATLGVRLSNANGPIAGAEINVTIRVPEQLPERWNEVTGADGTAEIELAPGPARKVLVRFLGDDARRGIERTLEVSVAQRSIMTVMSTSSRSCRKRRRSRPRACSPARREASRPSPR
jgi:hypothetical protein